MFREFGRGKMKNDDSCCQQGKNKDFKGSKCGCTEELDEEKTEAVEVEEDHGCACCHDH
jgi:hypothetical protein